MNYHNRDLTVNLKCTLQNALGLTADQLKTIEFGSKSFNSRDTRHWPTELKAEMQRLRARLKKRQQRGKATADIVSAISVLENTARLRWPDAGLLAEQWRLADKRWQQYLALFPNIGARARADDACAIWQGAHSDRERSQKARELASRSLPPETEIWKPRDELALSGVRAIKVGMGWPEEVPQPPQRAESEQPEDLIYGKRPRGPHVDAMRHVSDRDLLRESLHNIRDDIPAGASERIVFMHGVRAEWHNYRTAWRAAGRDSDPDAYRRVQAEIDAIAANRLALLLRARDQKRLNWLSTRLQRADPRKQLVGAKSHRGTQPKRKAKVIAFSDAGPVERHDPTRLENVRTEIEDIRKGLAALPRRKRIARRYRRKLWRMQLRSYSKLGVRQSPRICDTLRAAQRSRRRSILRGDFTESWHHRVI